MKIQIYDRKLNAYEEALRIACADAWPGESQWHALYLKRAKSNLSVAEATPQEKTCPEHFNLSFDRQEGDDLLYKPIAKEKP